MLDFLLQTLSLTSSLGAIYFTASKAKNEYWAQVRRRFGCALGALIATPVNTYLVMDSPMSIRIITVTSGIIYLIGLEPIRFIENIRRVLRGS